MDMEEFRIDRVAKMDTIAENLMPEVEDHIAGGDVEALYAAIAQEFTTVFASQPGFAIADTPDKAWNWFKDKIQPGIDAIKPTSVAETVAGWLGTAIVNGARVAAAEGASKTWISRKDGKVRPYHVEAHGQTVLWSDPFTVCNGVEVLFPGEPVGDPSCWINCRCVAAPANAVSSNEEVVVMADSGPPTLDGLDLTDEEAMNDGFDPSQIEDTGPMDGETLGSDLQWHGVLAPEGVKSGDGRMFAQGALSWRDLPLPLRWQQADTGGHDGAVTIATIDRIERRGNLLMGEGRFMDMETADQAVGMIGEGALKGVSIDADSAELAEGSGEGSVEFSKGRISAATLVAIPAFAEAYIALGPLPDGEEEMVTSDTTLSDEGGEEFKAKKKYKPNNPRRNTGLRPIGQKEGREGLYPSGIKPPGRLPRSPLKPKTRKTVPMPNTRGRIIPLPLRANSEDTVAASDLVEFMREVGSDEFARRGNPQGNSRPPRKKHGRYYGPNNPKVPPKPKGRPRPVTRKAVRKANVGRREGKEGGYPGYGRQYWPTAPIPHINQVVPGRPMLPNRTAVEDRAEFVTGLTAYMGEVGEEFARVRHTGGSSARRTPNPRPGPSPTPPRKKPKPKPNNPQRNTGLVGRPPSTKKRKAPPQRGRPSVPIPQQNWQEKLWGPGYTTPGSRRT